MISTATIATIENILTTMLSKIVLKNPLPDVLKALVITIIPTMEFAKLTAQPIIKGITICKFAVAYISTTPKTKTTALIRTNRLIYFSKFSGQYLLNLGLFFLSSSVNFLIFK